MIELNKIHLGDCLEGMRNVADKSVNLVCIDPPYNIKKAKWDTWKTVGEYVDFMGQVFKECERVLKDNGSFYFFHNDFLQIVEIQNWINSNTAFQFKQLIVWNKKFKGAKNEGFLQGFVEPEGLRNYQQMAEYALFYTFQKEDDISGFQPLRDYFKALQGWIGTGLKAINTKLGHRKAEHAFYHSSTQWELPTESTYDELIEMFRIDVWEGFKPYEELQKDFECLRYTFNNQKTSHSVWNYEIAPKLGHVTPKPVELIENIIKHSSNEGDIVLDCFMGSGTTAIACLNTNRNYIGFEKDATYHALATERVRKHQEVKSITVPDLFSQAG